MQSQRWSHSGVTTTSRLDTVSRLKGVTLASNSTIEHLHEPRCCHNDTSEMNGFCVRVNVSVTFTSWYLLQTADYRTLWYLLLLCFCGLQVIHLTPQFLTACTTECSLPHMTTTASILTALLYFLVDGGVTTISWPTQRSVQEWQRRPSVSKESGWEVEQLAQINMARWRSETESCFPTEKTFKCLLDYTVGGLMVPYHKYTTIFKCFKI